MRNKAAASLQAVVQAAPRGEFVTAAAEAARDTFGRALMTHARQLLFVQDHLQNKV